MRGRRHPKRLPHVHHCKANTRPLLLAKPGVELCHAGLRSILAAKPDRSTPYKIADHDPIAMTLADRNLADPDDQRTRRASCAFKYCNSSALTVCQSSANSFATSEIDACRQRRPTK